MKKLIAVLVMAFLLGGAGLALADENENNAKNLLKNSLKATGVEKKDKKTTSTPRIKPELNVVCIQNATDLRESAIIASFEKKSGAIKTALNDRKIALKDAWSKPTARERWVARAAAWKKFRAAVEAARKIYRDETKAAWKEYYKARVRCNAKNENEEAHGTDNAL